MTEYLRFDKLNNGWIDPDTGKVLQNIEGRRNIREGERFMHLGYIYPRASRGHRMRVERKGYVVLELEIGKPEADTLIANDPEFRGRYLTPQEISNLPKKGPP